MKKSVPSKARAAKAPARKAAKAAAPPKRQPWWLTQEQVCQSLWISATAFQRWGVPSVAKIGRCTFYEIKDVLENRLQHQAKKHEAANAQPMDDVEMVRAEREEKLALTKAQRVGQELKNQQLSKELAPVSVIEYVVGKAGGQISAILDALPMQIKKRNSKLTATDIEVIKREIVKAQNAASQMTVDLDEYYERDDEGDT